jgi:hypothetical protein
LGHLSVDNDGAMATRRTRPTSPATLLTLALLMSVFAAADGSITTTLAGPTSRRVLTTVSQREQVAHLLACLSKAARQFHGRSASIVPAAPAHGFLQSGQFNSIRALAIKPSARGVRPRTLAPPALAHLIDLPPPAARLV